MKTYASLGLERKSAFLLTTKQSKLIKNEEKAILCGLVWGEPQGTDSAIWLTTTEVEPWPPLFFLISMWKRRRPAEHSWLWEDSGAIPLHAHANHPQQPLCRWSLFRNQMVSIMVHILFVHHPCWNAKKKRKNRQHIETAYHQRRLVRWDNYGTILMNLVTTGCATIWDNTTVSYREEKSCVWGDITWILPHWWIGWVPT